MRGEIKKRFDPNYHSPTVLALIEKIKTLNSLPLGKMLSVCYRYPTFYGIEYKLFGVRVLKGENITEFGEITDVDEPSYIDPEISDQFPLTVVMEGDLVMSVRGEVGKVGFVSRSFAGSNLNANTIRLSFNEVEKGKTVLSEFVWLFLNSSIGRRILRRQIAGGVQETITSPEIQNLLIPLPVLATQRALVVEMQAARESRQQKLAQADALLAGLDAYLLEQLGITPPQEDKRQVFAVRFDSVKSGRCDAMYHAPHFAKLEAVLSACAYPKISLGEISPDIAGGATPTKGDAELYDTEGVKFLRILNVAPNEIDLADVKYVKEAVHNGELSRSQLAANDVLMTITGRVGTAAVVSQEILPANINQHIARLRIQRTDCLPQYLAAYLSSSIGLALSNRRVTGGTRIALDYEAVRKIQIPIPPAQIQNAIVVELNRRREHARQLRAQAAAEWDAAKTWFEEKLLGE